MQELLGILPELAVGMFVVVALGYLQRRFYQKNGRALSEQDVKSLRDAAVDAVRKEIGNGSGSPAQKKDIDDLRKAITSMRPPPLRLGDSAGCGLKASDLQPINDRQDALSDRLDGLQGALGGAVNSLETLKGQVVSLDGRVESLTKDFRGVKSDLKRVNSGVAQILKHMPRT